MGRRVAIAFLSLSSATACASSTPPTTSVSVGEVIENIHSWDGKQVVVDGWLGKCEGLDCAIFPDLKTARGITLDDWGKGLSIGSEEKFDERATALQFSHVLLTARVNDDCFPVRCSDRADILQPIAIRSASPKANTRVPK